MKDTKITITYTKDGITKMLGSKKTKSDIDYIYEQVDFALYNLLLEFKDKLPPLDENFHETFRKYRSIGENVDSAIWHLLNISKLFWKTINSFYEEEKENFDFGDKVMVKNNHAPWIKATFINYYPNSNDYRYEVCTPYSTSRFQYCRKGWDENDSK